MTSHRRPTSPFRLDRRTFLRGALGGLGVSLALPALDVMLDRTPRARADASVPTRFGVFYWGGGIVRSSWIPTETGAGFTLPHALEPFEAVRDRLTVVTGTNHIESSPGHIPARGIALSASHDLDTSVAGEGTYRGQAHPEPSIDQLVAEHWRGSTAFDSVEIGICRKGPYQSNSSWTRGGAGYLRHEPSPLRLYERLFGGFVDPATSEDRLVVATRAFERSMLDAVLEDARTLRDRLGARDRARLEQHLEGLRAIEMRLAERMVPATCSRPGAPLDVDYGDEGVHEEKEAKSRVMSELLAIALACDLSRVFSYEWSATQSGAVYWELGVSDEHHQLTHDDPTGERQQNIVRFTMQNLAYLAEKLDELPEGDGTVLDHSLILGTSEHANAGMHDYVDHPFVLVGGANGGLRAGIHHRHASPDANTDAPRVLLTALHAVGLGVDELGQAAPDGDRRALEPLAELLP
ncbi:MAG: DUF1552 domain-containing protein [Sandaracinaceae bacterium]|nr:DUF1552 domain-containing protein [Sandaracinaceae bacterium]